MSWLGSKGNEQELVNAINDYIKTFNEGVMLPLRKLASTPGANATIPDLKKDVTVMLDHGNKLLGEIAPKNGRIKEIIDNNNDIKKELAKLGTDAKYMDRLSILSALAKAQQERHGKVFGEILLLLQKYSDAFDKEVYMPIRTLTRTSASIRAELSNELPNSQLAIKRGIKVLEDTFSGSNRVRDMIDNNNDLFKELDKLRNDLEAVEKRLKNLNDLSEAEVQRKKMFMAAAQPLKRAA
jgi:hypothetical protein